MIDKFTPVIEFMKSILPSRMKGKTVMWWITVNVFTMCWYALVSGKPLDGSIAAIYGLAVGAFAGGKGYESYRQYKQLKDGLPAGRPEDPPGGYK